MSLFHCFYYFCAMVISVFRFIVIMALFVSALKGNSQSSKTPLERSSQPLEKGDKPGVVTFRVDTGITSVESGFRGFGDIRGYRIQIYLGPVQNALTERNRYLSLGLPYSAYIKQIVPEQAIQIGDFITKRDMEKHLEIIKRYYPKAFPIVDIIEPPKFARIGRD